MDVERPPSVHGRLSEADGTEYQVSSAAVAGTLTSLRKSGLIFFSSEQYRLVTSQSECRENKMRISDEVAVKLQGHIGKGRCNCRRICGHKIDEL